MAEEVQHLSSETLRAIILELDEPIVFDKTILQFTDGTNMWKILDWNLQEFSEKMGDVQLTFRTGVNAKTKHPQWEVESPIEVKTMQEFLKDIETDKEKLKWYYFDYKYMHEWCKDKLEILNSINWQRFGFDLDGSDSTLWIGSQGAHSICHQDTYGCNLVAQVQGRKRWILFPPKCNEILRPTRVPYEESTIYSKLNFFSPCAEDIEEFEKVSGGKTVLLEPGQVLFVPSGWWHYVESLDTSISVNVWLPLKSDCKARLKEALVKMVVDRLGEQIPRSLDQPQYELVDCLNFIKFSLNECKNVEKTITPVIDSQKSEDQWTVKKLKDKFTNTVMLLQDLTGSDLVTLLNENRFVNSISKSSKNLKSLHETDDRILDDDKLSNAVLSAFCHPIVISKVAEILLEEFI